ncbi:MAG: hypothetical protein RDU20_21550 [Desulfomonilaceae bacterium]|nr:hypothetical protein [Desulfomonilaceae bacterium]
MKAFRNLLPAVALLIVCGWIGTDTSAAGKWGVLDGEALAQEPQGTETPVRQDPPKVDDAQLSWEIPGRVSIYSLEFGPALWKGNEWEFVGNSRTFNAGQYKDRLTLMVRFSYFGSRSEIPLKFVIKLPDSRQYDETVSLLSRRGQYTYHFTIHRPEDFLGSGSVYLYYGFSMVDVLDFTIVPGS